MTKREKELNSEKIIKLAESDNLTVTQATLEFAKKNDIKPERMLSRITEGLIELIKEETRLDEMKFHIHKFSLKDNSTLEQ